MRTTASTNPLPALAHHGKISPAFSARLGRLKPQAKLHAIVLLGELKASRQAAPATRPTPVERRAAIEEMRGAAVEALDEIDNILRPFGGRRLSDKPPTALGTISIESNPAGIAALAESGFVRAILEDQPISSAL